MSRYSHVWNGSSSPHCIDCGQMRSEHDPFTEVCPPRPSRLSDGEAVARAEDATEDVVLTADAFACIKDAIETLAAGTPRSEHSRAVHVLRKYGLWPARGRDE